MKAIRNITAALLIIIIAVTLTACSSDFTGTEWQLMRAEVRVNGAVAQEICPPENGEIITYTFGWDGIFSVCTDTGSDLEPIFGVWECDGNYITLTIDGQDVRGVYALDGNELTIVYEDDGSVIALCFKAHNN